MSISVQNVAVCLSRVAAMLGLFATASVAWAQAASGDAGNAIERIDAIQTSSGVVVSIELKNAPQGVPASFSVANPARVALDMPATVNGLGKNMVELNQGDVRSVNVVQSAGRSRVVVNLKRALTHTV
ncbi:MAG TPA: AMIN domain-containing protein, partial [Burkholderiaceae bacterium]|nr:AMIN domain-containing protein [Burkholderiaceae bacterium]